jgi:acyl carrier protein
MMESMEEIKQTAQNVILEVLPNITSDDLQDDSDLFNLGLDSITAMSMVLSLQETFGVMFDTNDINFENFRTLANIVDLIKTKKDTYASV